MAWLEHEDLNLNPKHSLKELKVLGSSAILDLPGHADIKGHLELSGKLASFKFSKKFRSKK